MYRMCFLLLGAAFAGGCAAKGEGDLLDGSTAVYGSQYRQVLNNIAEFRRFPDTLPKHLFLRKGTLSADGAVGVGLEEFPVSYEQNRSLHWEVAALNDPDDITRVRLLYQWVVGRISYEALRTKWEANEAITGRPKVALPIHKDMSADWHCEDKAKAAAPIHGQSGRTKVWVRDIASASEFAIAVLRAAPNSRREGGRSHTE